MNNPHELWFLIVWGFLAMMSASGLFYLAKDVIEIGRSVTPNFIADKYSDKTAIFLVKVISIIFILLGITCIIVGIIANHYDVQLREYL